ncbi:MAG: FAD-dependent oxidoreductase [Eudoraea sp.]|nr:FAD-dependent oxidoreductase [Eudoraea sp.]
MSKNIVVIGGGIVGLSCAYYLLKDGHTVTVIDKSDMTAGASYVNAGYLTPSHIIPLASPGMMAKGIKYMFSSSSPFYMKPRFDMDFIKWAWNFNRSATKANVDKAIPLIKDINLLSKELFEDLHDSGDIGEFQLEKKGLLMLYKTKKAADYEKEVARRASDEGLDVKELSRKALDELQPHLSRDILGAVHYECDAHTTPGEIMTQLQEYLQSKGVQFRKRETVQTFRTKGSKIAAVITNKGQYQPDEVVFASGSWTQQLGKALNLNVSIQPGKGYRINVHRSMGIVLPAVLMEAKVAVTPMQGFTRFAGTMELSGINHTIRIERVRAIAKAAGNYYETAQIKEAEIKEAQCGLRPVTPDGLPYIGRPKGWDNVTIATGHAMMGWSLGPATGKLVSEIISEKTLSMNIEGFHPERRF